MEEEKKTEAQEVEVKEEAAEEIVKLPIPWGWVIFFGVIVSLALFCFIMIMVF